VVTSGTASTLGDRKIQALALVAEGVQIPTEVVRLLGPQAGHQSLEISLPAAQGLPARKVFTLRLAQCLCPVRSGCTADQQQRQGRKPH